jgi:hypothetical protein
MLFVLLQYMDSDYLLLVIMLFVFLQYMDSDYLPLIIMLFVLLQYMDSDYLPLVIMLAIQSRRTVIQCFVNCDMWSFISHSYFIEKECKNNKRSNGPY